VSETSQLDSVREELLRLADGFVRELEGLNQRLIRVEQLSEELLVSDDPVTLDGPTRRALLALRRVATEYVRTHDAVRDDARAARDELLRSGSSR
jgi:hypothetical protein